MNYTRLALAALGGTVAQLAVGFLLLGLMPGILEEARKYPAVFRPEDQMMSVLPIAIVAILASILVAAVLFAKMHPRGAGAVEGARFGALVGLFVVLVSAAHSYVNLNIGTKLALLQAAAFLVQWVAVGTVIGLIYKPRAAPSA